MIARFMLSALLLMTVSLATVVMQSPFMTEYSKIVKYNQEKNSYDLGEHYLGKLSPGQTLKLVFSTDSGTPYDWDQLVVKTSPGLTASLKTKASEFEVTLHANEPDENAWVELYFVEEFMFRGTERIVFKLNVTPGAYEHEFVQESVPTATDSYYVFNVKSDSLVDDVVSARLTGLPAAWSSPANAIVRSGEVIQVKVPVRVSEEGKYNVLLSVEYASGLRETFNRQLWAKPTMRSKMKSIGEGFVLVPGVLQPLYSIIGFIGSLL